MAFFHSTMSLHHRNGDRLQEPQEWLATQMHLVHAWDIAQWEHELTEEQILRTWISLFAKWARDICDHDVDVETFDARFLQFENRLLPALMVYVWQFRDAVGQHIPLTTVTPHVCGSLSLCTADEKNILHFSMNVPCDDGNGGHTEIVEFPVNGVLAKTFHSQ